MTRYPGAQTPPDHREGCPYLFGQTCLECGGLGLDFNHFAERMEDCDTCLGTGRIEGRCTCGDGPEWDVRL